MDTVARTNLNLIRKKQAAKAAGETAGSVKQHI